MKISVLVALVTVAAALPSYATAQVVTLTPAPVPAATPTAAPVTPTPTTKTPVTPAPVTPAPVAPTPTTKAPVTPAPVTPAPVTPTPTTKTPVTPAPVTPTPTTKAPVTPTPTTKAPAPAPAPTTKAPAATPATTLPKGHTFPADCTEVSVQGDATFCINGPVCSGNGASPAGTKCPMKGDYASDDCFDYLNSSDPKSDYCIAPMNASCAKIKTGAWGCVWNFATPAPAPAPTTKAPPGTPAATTTAPKVPTFPVDCTEVSVEGDATFCISGSVCSGSGVSPTGGKCPVKGDYAIDDCFDYLKSADSKSDYCIAPMNSTCAKIKTGAWGCVWNYAAPATPAPTTKAPVVTPAATTTAPVTPAPTTKAPAPAPVTPATTTKAPTATPAVTTTAPKGPTFPADCVDISVEGDATFCINGPVCSGSGASPAGSKCPVKGDYAIDDCYNYLKSADPKGDYCIAPVNATCAKVKSGVWGCVWNLPSSSTKTSFAIDGAATSAGSSVGAIAGIVAAAFAVAGAAIAAVVVQRKKRADQQHIVEGEFCLANSPVRSA